MTTVTTERPDDDLPDRCPHCGSGRIVLADPRRSWRATCLDCGAALGGGR